MVEVSDERRVRNAPEGQISITEGEAHGAKLQNCITAKLAVLGPGPYSQFQRQFNSESCALLFIGAEINPATEVVFSE